MQVLHKGECEHCHELYRYSLWNAGLGECSYAYCDSCGKLATISYHDPRMALLPPTDIMKQEIDASWEPYLAPCSCGGSFRRGASPRCPSCNQRLSAELATEHIEMNEAYATRNWRWQQNWSDEYCIAMEDPDDSGELFQVTNPFAKAEQEKPKRSWTSFFS
jgi:hypothetical protein